jgi:uncharacterized protein (DUF169 family)
LRRGGKEKEEEEEEEGEKITFAGRTEVVRARETLPLAEERRVCEGGWRLTGFEDECSKARK